jgi:hypothetical protein
MFVFIPMVENTFLDEQVERSIDMQTSSTEIVECYAPGTVRPNRDFCEERLINEPIARNLCKKNAIDFGSDFCVIQDDDIFHTCKTNFEDMKRFLTNNTDFGAVSIGGQKEMKHIKISCVMFRLDCLSKIDFIRSTFDSCMCNDVAKSIIREGFKFDYLDTKTRVLELA